MLTAFGEPEVKTFVRASIDEALKLERAMSSCAPKNAWSCFTILPSRRRSRERPRRFIRSLEPPALPRWWTATAPTL